MASDNALGFSKKIGIGLPGRMNKRDALALTGPPHHVLCGIHRRCPRENKALPIGLDRQARGRESVELESPYERREKVGASAWILRRILYKSGLTRCFRDSRKRYRVWIDYSG